MGIFEILSIKNFEDLKTYFFDNWLKIVGLIILFKIFKMVWKWFSYENRENN